MDIFILRGPPGVGKSTVGKGLLEKGKFGAAVDIDQLRSMLSPERFTYGVNGHYINAVRAAAALAVHFKRELQAPILVIDVFCAMILEVFLKELRGLQVGGISLYADNQIVVDRMINRRCGYLDTDVAKRVNEHIYATRTLTKDWLDTSEMNVHQVVNLIMRRLAAQKHTTH